MTALLRRENRSSIVFAEIHEATFELVIKHQFTFILTNQIIIQWYQSKFSRFQKIRRFIKFSSVNCKLVALSWGFSCLSEDKFFSCIIF